MLTAYAQQTMSALDHADICACVVAQTDFCENWPALMLISPLFAAAVRATTEYKFLREYNCRTAQYLLLKAASAQPRVYKIEQWCIENLPANVVYQVGLCTVREDLVAPWIYGFTMHRHYSAILVLNDLISASHTHPQIVTW